MNTVWMILIVIAAAAWIGLLIDTVRHDGDVRRLTARRTPPRSHVLDPFEAHRFI